MRLSVSFLVAYLVCRVYAGGLAGGYERVWFYYAYLTELAAISDATARGIPVPPRVICPHCVGNTWDTADTFDKFMAGIEYRTKGNPDFLPADNPPRFITDAYLGTDFQPDPDAVAELLNNQGWTSDNRQNFGGIRGDYQKVRFWNVIGPSQSFTEMIESLGRDVGVYNFGISDAWKAEHPEFEAVRSNSDYSLLTAGQLRAEEYSRLLNPALRTKFPGLKLVDEDPVFPKVFSLQKTLADPANADKYSMAEITEWMDEDWPSMNIGGDGHMAPIQSQVKAHDLQTLATCS